MSETKIEKIMQIFEKRPPGGRGGYVSENLLRVDPCFTQIFGYVRYDLKYSTHLGLCWVRFQYFSQIVQYQKDTVPYCAQPTLETSYCTPSTLGNFNHIFSTRVKGPLTNNVFCALLEVCVACLTPHVLPA